MNSMCRRRAGLPEGRASLECLQIDMCNADSLPLDDGCLSSTTFSECTSGLG